MKCKACNFRNPNKNGFCEKCLNICNQIAIAKMVNAEPLPEGNTLHEDFTKYLKLTTEYQD